LITEQFDKVTIIFWQIECHRCKR